MRTSFRNSYRNSGIAQSRIYGSGIATASCETRNDGQWNSPSSAFPENETRGFWKRLCGGVGGPRQCAVCLMFTTTVRSM